VADDQRPISVLVRRMYQRHLRPAARTARLDTAGRPHRGRRPVPLPVTSLQRRATPPRLTYTVFQRNTLINLV